MFNKSTFFSLLAAVVLASSTVPLAADVTYTYTGNDFTIATSPYTHSDSVSGFFTLAAALNDNFSGAITPTSYSFTDGVQTFTNASPPATVTFEVDTGASGNITEWFVFLQNTNASLLTNTVSTGSGADFVAIDRDFGNVPVGQGEGQGAVLSDAGTWEMSGPGSGSTVPEPRNVAWLLAFGFAGVVTVQKIRRQRIEA